MAIGDPALDEGRRRLVGIFKELADANREGRGNRIMNKILTDLQAHAEAQFPLEEDHMEKAEYPDQSKHQAQHRQLAQKLEKIRVKHQVAGQRVTRDMLLLLQYWVAKHLLTDDKAYAGHLAGSAETAETAETATVPD